MSHARTCKNMSITQIDAEPNFFSECIREFDAVNNFKADCPHIQKNEGVSKCKFDAHSKARQNG